VLDVGCGSGILSKVTGLQPGISSQLVGQEISRLKRGEITYAELDRRMKFQTGGHTNGNYIGYAMHHPAHG
jgi:hypothetical protein